MIADRINIEETINRARDLMAQEKDVSLAFKSTIEVLILLVSILAKRLGLNSRNSSKPPSSDPNREKKSKEKTGKKPGGQEGHPGTTLKKVDDPDIIKRIPVDRSGLPKGKYRCIGYEARQVVDIQIRKVVTEYQAEILEDPNGNRYVAAFPEGVTQPVQYGDGAKAHSVYMSQYQMIPYNRIVDAFEHQMGIVISAGSIVNFNRDVYTRLEDFEKWVKARLSSCALLHLDETGINIGGARRWLHTTSTDTLSYFYPHDKRGGQAIIEIGIVPRSETAILCHDHWQPYFNYDNPHALCNAHHLRELTRAGEQDNQQWAIRLHALLTQINKAVKEAGGSLDPPTSAMYHKRYQDILAEAEIECPPPKKDPTLKKRGKLARSKARNLLERLHRRETETLRFMDDPIVPFTNNQAENDLRMIKVQQKVSGCFRSMEGAKIFCRIRSYLVTCRKHCVCASDALQLLFQGRWPAFMEMTTDQTVG